MKNFILKLFLWDETCLDVKILKLNITDDKKRKSIKVTVTNMNGDSKFNDTKYFLYKISNSFTLVETDKPVYKPGDKGTLPKSTRWVISWSL